MKSPDRFEHKKSLGQHFLKQIDVAEQIVEALAPVSPDMAVLEIGPGAGILTRSLWKKYNNRLWVSEIDPRAIRLIEKDPGVNPSNILEGDFLKMPWPDVKEAHWAVIGNFPYNISSQIVFKILDFEHKVPLVVGMYQREMAERLCAEPGGKDYGVITACAALFYQMELMLVLPPSAFDPPPKVYSSVVRMKHRNVVYTQEEVHTYRKVVKTAFQQRRKKVSNALKGVPGALDALSEAGLLHVRAENIGVQEYLWLSRKILEVA